MKKQFNIVFIALLTLSLRLYADHSLQLSFTQKKEHVQSASITITLTNNSNEIRHILLWNTPFESQLSANIFEVKEGNRTVPYLGRTVKRSVATDSDYVLFEEGETRSITLEMPRYYQMQDEANYTISYKGDIKSLEQSKRTQVEQKNSQPSITIGFTPQKKSTKNISYKVSPNFNGCSSSQINILNTAHDASIVIARDAYTVMQNSVANTTAPRYRTWFGVASSSRQSTVTTHFKNIYEALDTKSIRFDCTCSDNYYAYVYPYSPYVIYLCNSFWYAPTTGTDSQSGTLIHEMAHFNIVANTDDYVYGQTGAKALAISNPYQALFNSDNHEYFAENRPYLAMYLFLDTDNDGIDNSIDSDDDNDGISDILEIANGLDPLNASDANEDWDGDGFTNAFEISFGSDIQNANSHPIWTPIMVGDIIIFVPSH